MADSFRLSISAHTYSYIPTPNTRPPSSWNIQSQILIIGGLGLASTFFSTFFSTLWMQHSEALREPIHRVYCVYPPFRSLQLVSPLPTHPTTIEFKLFIISILPRDVMIFSLVFLRNFLSKVYRKKMRKVFAKRENAHSNCTVVIWRCQNWAKFCGNRKKAFLFQPSFAFC